MRQIKADSSPSYRRMESSRLILDNPEADDDADDVVIVDDNGPEDIFV